MIFSLEPIVILFVFNGQIPIFNDDNEHILNHTIFHKKLTHLNFTYQMLINTKKYINRFANKNLQYEMSVYISLRESPFIIAKRVNMELEGELNLSDSKKRHSPRNTNPMKKGNIPTIALVTIGRETLIVLLIKV